MSVKIWQCFRDTDGIGVEDGGEDLERKSTTMVKAGG
jgi:hypothetical protein